MKFSRWLNSLNYFEQFLLLIFGVISWALGHYTIKALFNWIYKKRAGEKFVSEFRQTPMLTFLAAIPYFLAITAFYFNVIKESLF